MCNETKLVGDDYPWFGFFSFQSQSLQKKKKDKNRVFSKYKNWILIGFKKKVWKSWILVGLLKFSLDV